MAFQADTLGIPGPITTVLRDLIHERLGLFYQAAQFDQLADRLAPLVVARGFGSFMEYYYLLKYADDRAEWGRVMDALAVNETYFWREIDQLRAVVEQLVPSLVRSLNGRPLRVWSVPCATGDEPLTLAMLLEEAGWFGRAPIEIAGSDASPAAIARAEAGRYRARAFRNLAPALKEKYFTAAGDEWLVVPHLRQRVRYDVVNLVDAQQVARHGGAPVIFCRNVFIYFSEQSMQRTLAAFEEAMPVPGYLCVGASESLLRLRSRFELCEIGGAFMYVNQGRGAREAATSTRRVG
jgi:chemotaxis protein methyltransferase CheR